jgi:hydroxymethylpyrimidine pyrophosphatase-like HAD family hydrolase
MKILASDFDGTFSMGIYGGPGGSAVSRENLDAVRRFRAAGNLFGFATGRNLAMLLMEPRLNGMEFDFLVGSNGAVIYGRGADGELRLLKELDISADLSVRVIGILADNAPRFLTMMTADKSYFIDDGKGMNELRRLAGSFDTSQIAIIDRAAAGALTGVQQISGQYFSSREAMRVADEVNGLCMGEVLAVPNAEGVDVTPKEVDKASGLREYLRLTGQSADNLTVIGDGANDITMIEAFGGCTVEGACEAATKAATRQYPSVSALIEEMLGQKR